MNQHLDTEIYKNLQKVWRFFNKSCDYLCFQNLLADQIIVQCIVLILNHEKKNTSVWIR